MVFQSILKGKMDKIICFNVATLRMLTVPLKQKILSQKLTADPVKGHGFAYFLSQS